MTTEADFDEGMAQAVDEGYLAVVGFNDNGDALYGLTDRGEEHVQELMDDMLDSAIHVFAQKIDIPLYMSRDLLLKRAANLYESGGLDDYPRG